MEHYLKEELYSLVRGGDEIFEFLQSGSLDGLWYWDLLKQEEEWMSPEFWRLFGYDPAEMPHSPSAWMEAIHPEDLDLAVENFQKHLADPNHPYDQIVRYRHKTEDRWITVRCRGIAIRDEDGTPTRMLGAHTDLTALREREEELRKTNLALVAARDMAESSLRAKSSLLETMSHEIRTPMNGIMGLADLLASRDLGERENHYVEVIRTSSNRLLSLMTDVLELARLEAGVLHDQERPFAVEDVVQAVLDLFEAEALNKNLTLTAEQGAEPLGLLIGSARLVQHVLMNLVSNALKFTDEGGVEIAARLATGSHGRHMLEVWVADTGPGVAPENHDLIFERFSTTDAPNGRGGAGLGLTIARGLCEAHMGTLELVATDRPGATFFARFSVERAEVEMPEARAV